MKISNSLIWLSCLVLVFALVASGVGVLYQDASSSFSFTTLRGLAVPIYGQGLYRYDTPISAIAFRMADVVTLVLGLPALVIGLVLYRRGSIHGGLLLSGALAYILYNAISVSFGAAYNNLFLVYLALLTSSLFALLLALMSFDLPLLANRFSSQLPRRGISIYFIVSGVLLALIWLLLVIIPALLRGQAPDEVASYTTFMTGVLDVAIVAPILICVGWLLWQNRPLGYLAAGTLLVCTVILGINITLGGIAQLQAGVVSLGQFIGMTASFSVLTLLALWFAFALFRNLADSNRVSRVQLRSARA